MDSQISMNKQQQSAISQAVPVAANTFGGFLNPNPLAASFPFAIQTQQSQPSAPPNPYLSSQLYQFNQTAAAQAPTNRFGGVTGQPFQMAPSSMQLQPAGPPVLAASMPMAALQQSLGVQQDKVIPHYYSYIRTPISNFSFVHRAFYIIFYSILFLRWD